MSAAALLGVVLDAIWQGAFLCAIVELGLRFVPRRNAATLAAIWTAVLIACVGAMTLDAVARHASPAAPLAAKPMRAASVAPPHGSSAGLESSVRASALAAAAAPVTMFEQVSALTGRAALPIVLVVLMIAVVRSCAVVLALRATLLARRRVTPIEAPLENLPETTRAYTFASSATATTPHVLGFGRPFVVLPSALLFQPPERIRGVVLHELAHVSRYDDVRGAIEAALAAVLWWNPGVRFALARSARLRERICDDAAVAATHDGFAYATILAAIARGTTMTAQAVPCFSARDTVLERVRAVLDRSVDHSPRRDRKFVMAAVVVATVLVFATAGVHVPVSAAPSTSLVFAPQAADHDSDSDLHFASNAAPEVPKVFRGTWTLDGCADRQYLRLEIAFASLGSAGSERWNETACVPAAEFRGMSATALASASGEKSFSVVRAAGRFDATGNFKAGSGAGTYVYVPSDAFAARIRALGQGTPTVDQLFALTMADFQSIELDAFEAHGYAAPTPDELARLAYVDASPQFVLTAVTLPAATKTVSQLLELRERGVLADEIGAIEGFGYHPTLEQFIRLAEVGVRPEWIAHLRAGGYKDTSVDDLIELRERGG